MGDSAQERRSLLLLLLAATIVALVVSGLHPYDRGTWVLEVLPVLVVLPLLFVTRSRYPLTTLLYLLIFVHALVLIMGGAYTYARVPLGFTLQDLFGFQRNPYDRLGHFLQGFVPAIAVREILIRGKYVRTPAMRNFVTVCIVLAISACYEFVEWGTALAFGEGAQEFLGTQGDVWDTQWDMFMAVIGAVSALLLLARLHDRQLRKLGA
ncbi:MAG: putative rane protein [Pseudomonadota bacterium]|jgi:putative membrane protein